MNTTQEATWPEEESLGNMAHQDMDFDNLLNLDFPLSADTTTHHDQSQYTGQPPNVSYGEGMSGLAGGTSAHDFAAGDWDMAMDMDTAQTIASLAGNQDTMHSFQQQMNPQSWHGTPQHGGSMDSQMGNMIFTHQQHIPPTPNSYEMHGGDPLRLTEASMAHHRQAFMNKQIQHQLQINQVKRETFTPLVSPAVTPQDSTFQRPHEFTIPGAYFSPLSSPAIQAQNGGHHFRHNHAGTQPSTAATSTATSPATLDLEMPASGADSAIAIPDRSRKLTRKGKSVVSRSGVRQSPVSKPQKRKSAALSTSLSGQELDSLFKDAQTQNSQSNLAGGTTSTDSSGGGSISPEPLTDSIMGPPPRPGTSSSHQSPTIFGQIPNHQQQQMRFQNSSAGPATPASLMSIDNPRRQGSQTPLAGSGETHPLSNVDPASLDDFVLPPSATNTALDSSTSTPRIIASRKTPKLGPLSTASTGRSGSATSSPAIAAMVSPSIATPGSAKRGSKKRSSISGSSSMVSPALRPKISPSIKPLLPEGSSLSDSQHAILLASKSNYTHLLEGTLLPGVSYPDSLSSGLTSKRTSHKLAEQGRRNRINEALKEMQSLLPPPALRPKTKADGSDSPDGKDNMTADDEQDTPEEQTDETKPAAGKKDKAAKTSKESSAAAEAKAANSKAATVENAIEYIRALQQERNAMAEAMKAKDSEVNDLRRKLRDAEFKLEGSKSASPDTAVSMTSPS